MARTTLQQGEFHLPVLVEEIASYLLQPSTRVIVDVTLGDAGHSLAMLERGGAQLRIIGLDVDPESLNIAQQRLAAYQAQCSLIKGNFRHVTDLLASVGVVTVDGILADLGISSRQIDVPERGLSYLEEGPLDLRLDPSLSDSAAELIATLEQDDLVRLLRDYGEEQRAKPIARAIVKERCTRAIGTSTALRKIIEGVVRGPLQIKSVARVFQALRIAVNDELGALRDFLTQAFRVLAPHGRLCVISYHSLEDRIVKEFFRDVARACTCPPEFPVCVCGKKSEALVLTSKPITPNENEIKRNSRARSAKLRVLQKRD